MIITKYTVQDTYRSLIMLEIFTGKRKSTTLAIHLCYDEDIIMIAILACHRWPLIYKNNRMPSPNTVLSNTQMSSISFKLPPDLSIFESGYVIQQDYMKSLFMDDKDEEYDVLDLFDDLYTWWLDLPREERAQTPFPQMDILGGKGFDSMVIWICGRRFVSHKDDAKGIGRLSEQDKDTLRKKKFVTAFGRNRNFDEGQMLFHVLPSQKT